MTYEEALAYIHSTLRFGSKPGLSRIRALLDGLGNPQDSLRFVHVAGTNGKGSTCAAVYAALRQAGLRAGLYISPYIEDFRERIQCGGQMISQEELADGVARIRPLAEAMTDHPTEFELITALAFWYFRRAGCDAVVLEVGLGGRFDATNVIQTPLVSVITSISYDHTEILGDTLAKIAFEKCGIIKPDGVTVTSPGQTAEAFGVIEQTCAERRNPLRVPRMERVRILEESLRGTRLLYGGVPLTVSLCGRHQIANFLTAYEVLHVLREKGFALTDAAIADGLAAARFPARMELLHDAPCVLLDGAHNPAGTAALAETVRRLLPGRRLAVVMGMLADKDWAAGIAAIAPLAHRFIAVRPDSPRALDPAKTAQAASRYCPDVTAYASYPPALADALRFAGSGGAVLICGSLYLAGPMRRLARAYFDSKKHG